MRRAGLIMSLSLLAALIVVAATAGSSRLHSGIAGRVVEGPTCPVETVPPSPQCAPRPIRATIRIQHVGSHGPGWTVRSAGDGRFRVRLAPATYLITPLRHRDSSFPRPPAPFRVRVRRDHFTSVTIEYDTGIR